MASQAALRDAEWDVVDLRWEHGPSPVQCVFRRTRGGWEPWVIVAQSAVMARAGREGLGLYAARSFKRDDYIGQYDGEVVGRFKSREEAVASVAARRLLAQGRDKLITRNRGAVELVDGENGGPPFLHRMNDPRGSGLRANVELTWGGWVMATQTRVPAFKLYRGTEANIASELRLSYTDEYWRLGTKKAPIDLTF